MQRAVRNGIFKFPLRDADVHRELSLVLQQREAIGDVAPLPWSVGSLQAVAQLFHQALDLLVLLDQAKDVPAKQNIQIQT